MSGTNYLVDTNAILYFLSGNDCMKPYISSAFNVSVISEMELLSYSMLSSKEEEIIKNFLDNSNIESLNYDVKVMAINIRRKYKTKLPDAIIAATAITNEYTLITADIGFKKIEGLKLVLIEP